MGATEQADPMANAPIDLVIQTRIRDGAAAEYSAWQTRLGETLQTKPGFLGQRIITPNPPVQADWVVIQQFASIADAKSWLSSQELAEALEEVRPLFVGKDDVFLRGAPAGTTEHVTALVSCLVPPEQEADFLRWERTMFLATSKAPGFLGHRLERPVPGIQERFVIALSFDSNANLTAWLDSPQRAALLKTGQAFRRDITVRKGVYGFGFWFPDDTGTKPSPMVIFKSNILVLLVLYPIVFLWDHLVGRPFLNQWGVPFWLALFVGNFVSTQLTGWWAVPQAFRWFRSWLSPACSAAETARGFAVIGILCAASMALCAYLLG